MTTHYLMLSGPLVPAALDGRKTQTRRVVSWHNSYVDGVISKYWRLHWHQLDFSRAWADKGPSPAGNPGPYLHVPVDADFGDTTHRVYPRYTPGDRLIFKETWCPIPHGPDSDGLYEQPDVLYRATGGKLTQNEKWRSSMLMPAWAARSVNRITDVRCQRVQEISEEDAQAEGCPSHDSSPRVWFACIWDRLNAERAPWNSNPLVYAITFKREKAPQ
jgi:hypothetical protein